MRCKACHYSLKNLTEYRCPECGREFDPSDPSSFEVETRKWSFAGFVAIVMPCCFAGTLLLLIIVQEPSIKGPHYKDFWMLGAILLSLFMCPVVFLATFICYLFLRPLFDRG